MSGISLLAQPRPPVTRSSQTTAEIVGATKLRDAFIGAVRANGLSCSLAAPRIELINKRSFGQYDDERNTVRTSDWTTLKPTEVRFFKSVAGDGASEVADRELFEAYAHRWTFVHEMAHWWQACQVTRPTPSLYQIETDANRIALAYWREADPQIVGTMRAAFRTILVTYPSPVPASEVAGDYFNRNDERLSLSSSLGYQWFQATMFRCLDVETPVLTFAFALTHPYYGH